MNRIKKELVGPYAGAAMGLVSFFAVGLLPGVLYGGYAGLALAAVLFGTPVHPTLLTRVMTFGGMALGLVAALSLFVVLGAFVGSVIGAIVVREPSEAEAEPEQSLAKQLK